MHWQPWVLKTAKDILPNGNGNWVKMTSISNEKKVLGNICSTHPNQEHIVCNFSQLPAFSQNLILRYYEYTMFKIIMFYFLLI